VPVAIARLKATGRYEYVEPDYIRRATASPVVQTTLSSRTSGRSTTRVLTGGARGADINAEAAWETATGAPRHRGLLDSGALTTHQDLAANMWVNPSLDTASFNDSSAGFGTVQETDGVNG